MTEEQKEQKTAFNQRIGQRIAALRKLEGSVRNNSASGQEP
jgi:hypothetical protein